MPTPAELAMLQRYDASYERGTGGVMVEIERSVCGCDFGANSWTTRAQADAMILDLGLGRGVRLLDLGSGSGWPALYIAQQSGCDAVLVDIPPAGIKIARERAQKLGISERIEVLRGDAAALDFPAASFSAVTHSDLLCCLVEKQAALHECRRVCTDDGRMLFTVLFVTPGLAPDDHAHALATGPDFIGAEASYPTLLAATGWEVLHSDDLTEELLATYRKQLAADAKHCKDLVSLIGEIETADRLKMWEMKAKAVERGLFQRARFVARPEVS